MIISGIIKEVGVPSSFSFVLTASIGKVSFSKPGLRGSATQKRLLCREPCFRLNSAPSEAHPKYLSVLLRIDSYTGWYPVLGTVCAIGTIETGLCLREFSQSYTPRRSWISSDESRVLRHLLQLRIPFLHLALFHTIFLGAKPLYLSSVLLLRHCSSNDQKDQI